MTDFKWDEGKVELMRKEIARGFLRMGADIASRARFNAPYLTGALRNSIRFTADDNDNVFVLAGGVVGNGKGNEKKGKRIDYARLREFHNKKNPSTTHYMRRAFDEVYQGDIKKYFGVK